MSDRIKLNLKYTFACTAKDLFLALSKPTYLSNWIADEVEFDSVTGVYTFQWASFSESAKVQDQKRNIFLKWEWIDAEDREDGDFVEFRIDAVKGEEYIDLFVTDFCDSDEERQIKDGWDRQMQRLDKIL